MLGVNMEAIKDKKHAQIKNIVQKKSIVEDNLSKQRMELDSP